jgi:hypothetical protein
MHAPYRTTPPADTEEGSPWQNHDPANPADRAEVEACARGALRRATFEIAQALDALTYGEWGGAGDFLGSADVRYPDGGVAPFMSLAIDLARQLVHDGVTHAKGAGCVVHLNLDETTAPGGFTGPCPKCKTVAEWQARTAKYRTPEVKQRHLDESREFERQQADEAETCPVDRASEIPPADVGDQFETLVDDPQTPPLMAAALNYAAAGWPVFPITPNGKQPVGRLAPHGFKDATTDRATIIDWWTQCPTANIGGATGAPGADVLDVDVKDGRTGMELFDRARQAGLLRGAYTTIRTPSGGLHVWFRGTDQQSGAVGGKFKPLELKARGGYVLLPPSYVVDDDYGYAGRYELIEWRETGGVIDFPAVRRLLDPPPVVRSAPRSPRPRTDNGGSVGDEFNQRAEWADILEPHGWVFVREVAGVSYWRRPGRATGHQATTNAYGKDKLKIHTTSTDFDTVSYSKFAAFTWLNFGEENWGPAVAALRELGYGTEAAA